MEQRATAWRDSREIEYQRIDDALRARMNYTTIRNVYAVAQKPETLLMMVELDSDIWDCIAPYYIGDKRRTKCDNEIDWLAEEANALFDEFRTNGGELTEDDIIRVRELLRREKAFYRELMDLRHEKGLDVSIKKPFTKEDKVNALTSIATGKFDE